MSETVHDLKIIPSFFRAVKTGMKGFEIRKNDRKFQVGDVIMLREYNEGHYTGRIVLGEITFVTDFEQKEGYVVFNFKRVRVGEDV
ncbi:DUF3850 domain-containing protein [Bacillus altitudinis]|uniref:DUF3850 domain-containing protein n=1 Tax=Bacillus altitudinis TaxID=293387 RepID=UPI0005D43E10|nr:DUF3850 domain-containing protein [Bacillus altitudinis]KJF45999.1 RNA-binding protein [Bacillus altitudinis]